MVTLIEKEAGCFVSNTPFMKETDERRPAPSVGNQISPLLVAVLVIGIPGSAKILFSGDNPLRVIPVLLFVVVAAVVFWRRRPVQ